MLRESSRIALKFDRCLGSTAAQTHAKFQSDAILAPISWPRDFTGSDNNACYRLVNTYPGVPIVKRIGMSFNWGYVILYIGTIEYSVQLVKLV